jgi:uncharacterized protein (DUF2141 family)
MVGIAAAIPAVASLALTAAPARSASVQVDVANVHHATGHVRVALCTPTTFLKLNCPYKAAAPAHPGETTVTFTGVAPGQYAAQAFEDVTDGEKIHRNLFGIPREGIGFSNDAALHMSGPKYKDAAFAVSDEGAQIRFKLRYLLGPDKAVDAATQTAASQAPSSSESAMSASSAATEASASR